MNSLPKKRTDGSYEAAAWNQLLDYVRASTPIGPGMVRTPNGTTFPKVRATEMGSFDGSDWYKGEWDSSTTYSKSEVVRVTTGAGSHGVFVSLENSNTNHAPVWPEPTEGTVYWEMICFWVSTYHYKDATTCDPMKVEVNMGVAESDA